jgi:hypothetical protein
LILVGPDPEGKNDPQKYKKNEEISCFEMLNIHFGGLKASPAVCTSFMEA